MADYYVSPHGSDANNGLGPDPTHATNKPWLTVAKATNTGSVVVPGDTVWIAPETIWASGGTPIAAIASVASPTTFRGDPLNSRGFKDGSGVLLPPRETVLTTRTSGTGFGVAIGSVSDLFNLNANGVDGLTFRDLVLECDVDNGSLFSVNYATVSDLLIEDCRLIGLYVFGGNNGVPTAGRNWRMRRCVQLGGLTFQAGNLTAAAATADADLDIIVEDCLLLGVRLGSFALGGAGGNLAGGIIFRNNTIIATAANALATVASRVSTVTPIRLLGNMVVCSVFVNAGTAGHVVDDGDNAELASFGSSNYTRNTAAGSARQPGLLLELPDLVKWGLRLPFADFLGWSPIAHANQRASDIAVTRADFRNRTVRPWGAGASVGYVEANPASQDTGSQITGGGANSLKITGQGEVSLFIPVTAAATTIAVTTKSSGYGGTNYPQLILVANPALGIASDLTDTAAAGTEEALSVGPFTPTAAGVVEVRLVSRSSSVSSATYFDRLGVTA